MQLLFLTKKVDYATVIGVDGGIIMNLKDYLDDEQIKLCQEVGIRIEDREYITEELYKMEQDIHEYINENCMDEQFYEKEEKLDEILDIFMDLENEENEINPMAVEYYEDDHVELNNGKLGVIADITNNVYTIEVDEEFKTGNIDDDIMIVAVNSIVRRV